MIGSNTPTELLQIVWPRSIPGLTVMSEFGLTEMNPWAVVGVHVPPTVVIVYWYVVWAVIGKLGDIVPEISIKVPPLLIIFLVNDIPGSSPSISFNEVLIE